MRRGPAVRTYYLYHLHPNGRIAARDDIPAEDDDQAIGLADGAGHGSARELWLGARLVKAFPARSGPLSSGAA